MQIALQGQAGLATGRYDYTIEITEHYGTPVTTTHTGKVNVINSSTSSLGADWSIAGMDRLHAVTGGVILEMAGGLSLWYADAAPGQYVTPAGDFSTLIKNGDNTWTRTLKDGTKVNFRTDGRQSSVVDRHNNTVTFNWNPDNTLSQIVDQNSVATNPGYTSGKVTSFTDVASRVTQLAHTSGRLTSVTMPDTAVWGHAYDSSNRMTSLTIPRNHTTTFGLNFAGRVDTITRPDTTTEGLIALQMRTAPATERPRKDRVAISIGGAGDAVLNLAGGAWHTERRCNKRSSKL